MHRHARARDSGSLAGGTLPVDLSALAPAQVGADAAAVAVNVTAAAPATAGYLTVWPCDSPRPLASSVNFGAGQARGAQATTLLGPGRRVCVFSNAATDIVVDLQGVFVASGGLRFAPVTPGSQGRHPRDRTTIDHRHRRAAGRRRSGRHPHGHRWQQPPASCRHFRAPARFRRCPTSTGSRAKQSPERCSFRSRPTAPSACSRTRRPT